MKLAFLSCDRTPRYIEKSLESAKQEGLCVSVYHDGSSPPIGDWFSVIASQKPESMPKGLRASSSYCDIVGESFDEDVLICEDDVILSKDLVRKINSRLARIPSKSFILSLYSTDKLHDQYAEHINPKHWHGSQGVYIPASQRKPLHAHFKRALEFGFGIDYAMDVAISNYCYSKCVDLFVANPNLVQHVGEVSSISRLDTGKQHSSPSFRP